MKWHTSNWLNSGNVNNTQLGKLAKPSQNAKLDFTHHGAPQLGAFCE